MDADAVVTVEKHESGMPLVRRWSGLCIAVLFAFLCFGCGSSLAKRSTGASWVHVAITFFPTQPVADHAVEVRLSLRDGANKPIENADVRLRCTMPGMPGMDMAEKTLRQRGAGIYVGRVRMLMSGRWVARVGVTAAGRRAHTDLPFTVLVG